MKNIFSKINTIIAAPYNINNVYNALHNQCSIAYELYKKNTCRFYRGHGSNKNIIMLSPIKRKSADTTNVYTFLLSKILPSWKKYPPRNKCIIYTNSIAVADEYTQDEKTFKQLYAVFPVNDAKLAICPRKDMWDSFDTLIDKFGDKYANLSYFNNNFVNTIERFAKEILHRNYNFESEDLKILNEIILFGIKHIVSIFNDENEQYLLDIFHVFEKYCNLLTSNNFVKKSDKFEKYLINELNNGKSMTQILDELFNPDRNGFKLTNMTLDFELDTKPHELYTANKCLLIEYRLMNYILDNDKR